MPRLQVTTLEQADHLPVDKMYAPDLITLIRAFYLLSAAAIVMVRFTPKVRERFIAYGARDSDTTQGTRVDTSATQQQSTPSSPLTKILNQVAKMKVPHSWFTHFYCLSSVCVSFWLYQFFSKGPVLKIAMNAINRPMPHTSTFKVGICMLLMALQSLRRICECLFNSKPSNSTMWIGHYVIGMVFYFFVNIAIWIENARLIPTTPLHLFFYKTFRGPDLIECVCFINFLVASKYQYEYHKYLASLEKYTLPDKWAFKKIVAPHYTAECVIYLSLAVVSRPPYELVNGTIFCAFVFVVVNLGITAQGTRQWMTQKFPAQREDIIRRWMMIPGIW